MKRILTVKDVAKMAKVSETRILQRCWLPATHPAHIQSILINPKMRQITDPKIIAEFESQVKK